MKENIIEVAKRRGFFWQNAQLHGGIAGFYDYAHLGLLLKRKWENKWREFFLGLDDNFYEIGSCCILPEPVFKASGHLASFVDPVARCSKCGNTERADQLLEGILKESYEGKTLEEMMGIIRKHDLRCPKCKGGLEEVGTLNMMFPVGIGTGNDAKVGYLSPETAQGAYINFRLEFEALRRQLPMGLAIVGKAFRNEIAPRNTLIRMREFTQAELQIFFDPSKIGEHPKFGEVRKTKLRLFPVKNRESGKTDEIACDDAIIKLKLPKFYVYHMAKIQEFYLGVLKLPKEKFRFRQLSDEEKAFYNKYHWDVEANTNSFGWVEVGGVHYRTDHDLAGHQKVSGQDQSVNIDGKRFIPHVLELSFGVDRNVYAIMDLSYREEKERTVFSFPRLVSPYDAALFPLVNKDGLHEKAEEIRKKLRGEGIGLFFDDSGSIGRRYRRMDEAGVSLCITVDHQTLEDGTVTIRERDSMKQIRIKEKYLSRAIHALLSGKADFENVSDYILAEVV